MGFLEIGPWTVTTTADAYGEADSPTFEPKDANKHELVWCVYDSRCDDEPVAAGCNHYWATRIAAGLNTLDGVLKLSEAAKAVLPDRTIELEGDPDPDPYAAVEHRGMWITCCKGCDGDRVMPMPFRSPEQRQAWRNTHAVGTGHREFYEVDPDGARGVVSILTRKVATSPLPRVTEPHYYQRPDVNKGFDLPCCDRPRDADIHLPPRTDPHQYNWNNGVNPCCHEDIDADIHRTSARVDLPDVDGEGFSGVTVIRGLPTGDFREVDHPEPDDVVDELSGLTDLGQAFIGRGVTGFGD